MTLSFFIDWYMIAFYCAGTAFGLYVGRKMSVDEISEATIDYLIENRLVKWRKRDDGEIELLEIDDTNN